MFDTSKPDHRLTLSYQNQDGETRTYQTNNPVMVLGALVFVYVILVTCLSLPIAAIAALVWTLS